MRAGSQLYPPPPSLALRAGSQDSTARFWCRARPGDIWADREQGEEERPGGQGQGEDRAAGKGPGAGPGALGAGQPLSMMGLGIMGLAGGTDPSRPALIPGIGEVQLQQQGEWGGEEQLQKGGWQL